MCKRLPRAFTLVELLVVIGIIALLISILLPSLNRARRSARTVQCLSNLRQWGAAQAQYAAEHKTWAVPDIQGAKEPVNKRRRWNDNNDFRRALGVPEFVPGSGNSQRFPDDILCPEAMRTQDNANNAGGQSQFSYGYNITGMAVQPTPAPADTDYIEFRGIKIVRVRAPAEKIMFADAMDFHVNRAKSDFYMKEPGYGEIREPGCNNYVAYRHDGRINIVFWDGHAATLRRDEVACRDNSSPPWDHLWHPDKP